MKQDAALDISGLHLEVESNVILREVTCTITSGEYTAIIGPNGAGKTTLLKCVNHLIDHWQGSIRIYGQPLQSLHRKQIARVLSYVPQLQETTFAFTVKEFLMMSRFPYLSPFTPAARQDYEAVSRALTTTGMSAFSDRNLATLSSGERQKIFIAAALAQETPVLLLDEPVTFLDPRYQGQIHRLLHNLNREHGRTVITVSHDINGALMHADRILAIKNGCVAFNGPPQELTSTADILNELFDTKFTFLQHPDTNTPIVLPEQ